MKNIWRRFCSFSLFVQMFICFCLLGLLINSVFIYRDLNQGGVLLRLHLGFSVLYLTQIVFIFLHEKWVCVLTVLQGILALFTTADFVFVPLLRVLGQFYFVFFYPTIERMKIYKYVFISLAFTLQMFSAYVLFVEAKELQKED